MKAAIYNGLKDVCVQEIPTPECGDNEVLLKNIYSSICGTDVAVYFHGPNTGHKVTVGGEFGHETVSEVVIVGNNVKDIKVGDRVYPYPRLAKGDTKRAGTLGAFSEYILVPDCEIGKQVYPVSDKISSKTACLIEPFTIGCRAARRSKPQIDEHAIIFGAGTIGIASAIALRYFGCKKIMMVDLSDFRLDKARALGFEVCNSGKEDLKAKATDVFGLAPSLSGKAPDVDIYIDASGAPAILDKFMDMGKIECRIVVVGVHMAKQEVDILHLTYAQQAIIGSGGYMPEDVYDVMRIMESGTYDLESIITHEFGLDDIVQAIETAGNTEQSLNVVIKF